MIASIIIYFRIIFYFSFSQQYENNVILLIQPIFIRKLDNLLLAVPPMGGHVYLTGHNTESLVGKLVASYNVSIGKTLGVSTVKSF